MTDNTNKGELLQKIERLQQERNELAATVESLRVAWEAVKSTDWDAPLEEAFAATPQQHLAELKANAVADAVNAHPEKVAYIQFEAQTRTKGFHCEIWLSSSDLIRYADSVKAGEK